MKSKEAKQRQQIFFDTLDMIHSDKSLSEAVEASIEDLSVYSENEYVIANKTFGNVLENAVGATVRLLNTNVEGCPVVVYNPLSQDRTDIVEAELSTSTRPAGVRVYNKETGLAVPATVQILKPNVAEPAYSLATDSTTGTTSKMLEEGPQYSIHIAQIGYDTLDMPIANIGDSMNIALSPVKKGEVFIVKNLYFATNKTRILSRSEEALQALYMYLARNPQVRIKIVGHTDNVGKDAANQKLSDGRANEVMKDLIERNRLQHPAEMEELLQFYASSVGSLSSFRKLSATFKSVKGVSLSVNTIGAYSKHLEDAFLISRAVRYDIKGRRYTAEKKRRSDNENSCVQKVREYGRGA